jgi:membrane associated rhomboid family serine protease
MHLLANGLSLYILGSRTERHYGKIAFVVIYFVSGIVAGVASMLFGDALSAGASGAIFGLVGAMITYTFVVGKSMDGFDLQLALFYAVIGMGSGFLMENVDNFAHIGGFVTGALVSLPFALKLKKEVNNG